VIRALFPLWSSSFRKDQSGPGVIVKLWLEASDASSGATYIGSFMRAPSLGTSLAPTLGASGFFVIADRSARDLPIARTRMPTLPDIITQVSDVERFGNALLLGREPD